MLRYNTSSWHYRLVLYVYGKEFFFSSSMDHDKTHEEWEKKLSQLRKEYPNDDNAITKALREFDFNLFDNDEFLKYSPRRVNFCPYCRAVVVSFTAFPFYVMGKTIRKIIPKKKKERLSYEDRRKRTERNSLIIRLICGGVNWALGLKNIIEGDIAIGIIQIAIGLFLVFFPQMIKLITRYSKPIKLLIHGIKRVLIFLRVIRVKKVKIQKPIKEKTPNFISAFFEENHSKYCPPVVFVGEDDNGC